MKVHFLMGLNNFRSLCGVNRGKNWNRKITGTVYAKKIVTCLLCKELDKKREPR